MSFHAARAGPFLEVRGRQLKLAEPFDSPAQQPYAGRLSGSLMPVFAPTHPQPLGRTFIAAISFLGVVALAQVGAAAWALVSRAQQGLPLASRSPALHGSSGPEDRLALNDPFEEAPGKTPLPPIVPSKPQPVPLAKLKAPSPPETLFQELIEQGKILRERGDMGNALIKLREAQTFEPRNPLAIAEIAVTYEKMGLVDKANEQWKRIYDMGEGASIYYLAAQGRLKASQEQAMRAAQRAQQAAGELAEDTAGAFRSQAVLALGEIMTEEAPGSGESQHLVLRVPLLARPQVPIDVKDVVIQVLFYDTLDGKRDVKTNENVTYRWSSAPVDWANGASEVLVVEYRQQPPDPKARKENRKYAGYIVRVYYKDELQADRAAPPRLGQQFPAPQVLEKDSAPP
ncbi:MAG: hypothetical protein M3463_23735 [Verrucomicrobiota bacterium]|nr:hypothetical protein [Verrucomicrobiota bacterium]